MRRISMLEVCCFNIWSFLQIEDGWVGGKLRTQRNKPFQIVDFELECPDVLEPLSVLDLKGNKQSRRRGSNKIKEVTGEWEQRVESYYTNRKNNTSPLFSVDCWIFIFSYNSANSSLRRINCVPRISRSLITCKHKLRAPWETSVARHLFILLLHSCPLAVCFIDDVIQFLDFGKLVADGLVCLLALALQNCSIKNKSQSPPPPLDTLQTKYIRERAIDRNGWLPSLAPFVR